MRKEKDLIGSIELPADALYGIHSLRANTNFPGDELFMQEWYKAIGIVKQAAYKVIKSFRKAIEKEDPEILNKLRIPEYAVLDALISAAEELSAGEHYEYFIVPALQGGAGTSMNLNVNEIISNRALMILGHRPGDYRIIDPIEAANLYQSTNDVIPTSLTIAIMQLLNKLETKINSSREETEKLEKKYRHSLRISYTQLQEAVPGTFGQFFSNYSDALSRDWWRISKAFERIKQVNIGGGATGTGIAIPRYYIMEIGNQLRELTSLPLSQGENLGDITSNLDSYVEVHAILKAHAVNLHKIANDLRLLSSGVLTEKDIIIPDRQTGSSIMPGKINPVVPEFIISSTKRVFSNDQLITELASEGNLDLNAYIPSIGHTLLQSLKILINANTSLKEGLLSGLVVNEKAAKKRLFSSPAISTVLSPVIGYNRASSLAKHMKENSCDIFASNAELNILPEEKIKLLLKPENLNRKGFSIKDIE